MPDYNLKAALQRVKTSPSRFALVKGTKGSQVYVSPQPANAKQLAPIMAECGDGKTVATGICMLENDQLVFATQSAPSGALETMISNALKAHQAASFLPIGLRQIGENESDESSNEEGSNGNGNSNEEEEAKGETESEENGSSTDEAETKKLVAALNKIMPLVKAAVASHPARRDELLAPLKAFQNHLKSNEIPQAKGALLQASKLLKSLGSTNGGGSTQPQPTEQQQPTDSDSGAEAQRQQFAERRVFLEARLLAAQKAAPDKASKLLQLWDFAEQNAAAGKLSVALKALDGLQATIEKVLATGPVSDTERFGIGKGIVAERKAQLQTYFTQQVARARNQSVAGVNQMKSAFDEVVEESSELAAAINDDVGALYEEIAASLNQALESGSPEKIAQEIARCRGAVEGNALIQHLSNAPAELGIDPGLTAQFTELFDAVTNELEAVDA